MSQVAGSGDAEKMDAVDCHTFPEHAHSSPADMAAKFKFVYDCVKRLEPMWAYETILSSVPLMVLQTPVE